MAIVDTGLAASWFLPEWVAMKFGLRGLHCVGQMIAKRADHLWQNLYRAYGCVARAYIGPIDHQNVGCIAKHIGNLQWGDSAHTPLVLEGTCFN